MKFVRKNSKKYLIQLPTIIYHMTSSYQRILWATCIVFIIFLCLGIGLAIYYHGLPSDTTLGSINTKISSLAPHMTQMRNHTNINKIAKADRKGESNCSELTLSSKGMASQFYPGIIGDYLLQSKRNNGRAVYRSKEKIAMHPPSGYIYGYIYLYSFDAEKYADYQNYDRINNLTGSWVFSDGFNKVDSIIMINFLCKITTLPLGSHCNNNWWVTEKFGTKIQDTFFQDRSVTLECKNKVICIDENEYCNDWAGQGQCEKNPDYMFIGCRKSCHDCETNTIPTTTTLTINSKFPTVITATSMSNQIDSLMQKTATTKQIESPLKITSGDMVKKAENMCHEFTFSSYGIARRLYPGLIGDYLLQSERNNGRVMYRSKDEVILDQRSGYIYLYSFEYDEALKIFSDIWLVTYGVNWSHPDVYGILMFNSECRMKDHPFDSICDKRWIVNTFGNFEEYSNDPSITLICKN